MLIGVDRPTAVRLMARLPDPIMWHIGRELLRLDPAGITRREIDDAIRSLVREFDIIANAKPGRKKRGRQAAEVSHHPPLLTQQECSVLATVIGSDQPESLAVMLHRLPTPLLTRILLSMRPTTRSDLIQRYRRLSKPPRDLQNRLLSDLVARIPPRPFPALGDRFSQVVGVAIAAT